MDEPNCDQCQQHSGIMADIKTLKNDTKEQWDAINALRNRLPLWATIVISLLTFLLGLSLRYGPMIGAVAKAKG